ncbi:MAG TPA: hypothetical protein VKP00_16240 [Gemmatimonadaceae bacterium]|nr:hypothetical protein [Gemmatimonadaceae bacterium]
MTAQFKLSLLDCDTSDPLGDFFDARAEVVGRGLARQATLFTVAGRDLQAFVIDARRIRDVNGASALLTGGWDAEKSLRLRITHAGSSGAFVTRVCLVSDDLATDLQTVVETEFVASRDALSAFLTDIEHLVDRRELGDATLNGDADAQ